jgi:hypothetical protein
MVKDPSHSFDSRYRTKQRYALLQQYSQYHQLLGEDESPLVLVSLFVMAGSGGHDDNTAR